MLPRHYEDLTVTERENIAKQKIIDYQRRKKMQEAVQEEEKVLVENAELESKKRRFVDLFDQYHILLQNTLDLFLKSGDPPKMKTPQNNTTKFYENFVKF